MKPESSGKVKKVLAAVLLVALIAGGVVVMLPTMATYFAKGDHDGIVKSVKTEKRLPNYFKYQEFINMIEVIEDNPLGYRNRLILELLLATGIRVSELSNIKISDIDLNNREIKILGKGSKERIVFFGSYIFFQFSCYFHCCLSYFSDNFFFWCNALFSC